MSRNEISPADLVTAAAEWRLLSLLLARPTDRWRREVDALLPEVKGCPPSLKSASEEASEGAYLRVLGPGGVLSPREVAFAGFEDPGHLLSSLSAVYRAFAFKPRTEDPIDHVAVEAGFVAYLLLKEGYARMRGETEPAEITRRARRNFLKDHLGRLAAGMAEASTGSYLDPVFERVRAKSGGGRGGQGSELPTSDPLLDGCLNC